MMRPWKLAAMLPVVVLFSMILGASSCEEAQGIKTVPDHEHPGHYKVIEVDGNGKVGQILSTAGSTAGGLPIAGQVIGGLTLLAQLAHQITLARAKSRVQAENEEYDKTHAATKHGLQSFVDASPVEVGKALLDHLDTAHDGHDVSPAHQDDLQPVLKS